MNVLFLEDRGATAYHVTRWMTENGHTVFDAYNPADAQSYWEKRAEVPVHCVILDLQTPMDGLTDDQKMEAEGGTLAGWIWYRDNVLSEVPEMRQRTIIYSDFVPVLVAKRPEEEFRGIKVISKRQRTSAADEVVAALKGIEKKILKQ